MKDAAVNRLAKSITQLTLCQVSTSEVTLVLFHISSRFTFLFI